MPVKRPMNHKPATLLELARRMRSCAAELEKAATDMRDAGLEEMAIDHALSGLRGLGDMEQFSRSCAASYYAAREKTGLYGVLKDEEIVDTGGKADYEKSTGSGRRAKRS